MIIGKNVVRKVGSYSKVADVQEMPRRNYGHMFIKCDLIGHLGFTNVEIMTSTTYWFINTAFFLYVNFHSSGWKNGSYGLKRFEV